MKLKLMRRLKPHEYSKKIIHEIINLNRKKQVQTSLITETNEVMRAFEVNEINRKTIRQISGK